MRKVGQRGDQSQWRWKRIVLILVRRFVAVDGLDPAVCRSWLIWLYIFQACQKNTSQGDGDV